MFLSQYTYKVDNKGRISVPADFRISINTKSYNGIISFRSYKFKAIEGLDFEKMKKIADSLDDLEQRIHKVEHKLYPRTIKWLLTNY